MKCLAVAGAFVAVTLSSCAGNPINARTASDYSDAGRRAERSGDLVLARENYARAHANVVLGNLGPASEASDPEMRASPVMGFS